ncbi:helix-turn-helix protein [Paenibacillus taihuensis]|uniref:Helix-turn-helix protein n=1 Tax=Paenibacillus taihuensis TaxID=1156355 RepID=A0A3D9R184_9BACL|nr:helix-turn-helix transcriptional regulator [Paenibacillus taihuensis]REE67017.1 helix-turn-helix protein [Paenibacillus taihuensis]
MDNNVLEIIGRRIRDLRKQRGLSQEQLGEMAGVHFSYIGKIERAEKNVTVVNLEKIAAALGVSFFDLFLFGKFIRPEQNEKDKILNSLFQNLAIMKVNDLRKLNGLIYSWSQDQ